MADKNSKAAAKIAEAAITKKLAWRRYLPVIIVAAVIVILTVILFISGIAKASEKASEIYESRKNEQKENTVSAFLSAVHENVESRYHVSNDVKINLEFTEDISRLEVLTVYDTDYAINDDGATTIWTEIPATGIFTVDLEHAEMITDAHNGYVLVRIFKPELTSFGIDYDKINILDSSTASFFPWDNGSVKLGEEMAERNLREAQINIRNRMLNEPEYYNTAEKNAEEMIKDLLQSLNPERKLSIEVRTDLDK